jgi:hypothetical protein
MPLFEDIRRIADMQHALVDLADCELDDVHKRALAYSARAEIVRDPLASRERTMLDDCALQSERLRRALLAAGGNRRRFA